MTEAEQVADDVGASMNAITAGEKVQPQIVVIAKNFDGLELVDFEILKGSSVTTLADAFKLSLPQVLRHFWDLASLDEVSTFELPFSHSHSCLSAFTF